MIYFVILALTYKSNYILIRKGEEDVILLANFLRKKLDVTISVTSLNPDDLFRPLCHREIKQLSQLAPMKLFDRSRIALSPLSPFLPVVVKLSSSLFSPITVGQG